MEVRSICLLLGVLVSSGVSMRQLAKGTASAVEEDEGNCALWLSSISFVSVEGSRIQTSLEFKILYFHKTCS